MPETDHDIQAGDPIGHSPSFTSALAELDDLDARIRKLLRTGVSKSKLEEKPDITDDEGGEMDDPQEIQEEREKKIIEKIVEEMKREDAAREGNDNDDEESERVRDFDDPDVEMDSDAIEDTDKSLRSRVLDLLRQVIALLRTIPNKTVQHPSLNIKDSDSKSTISETEYDVIALRADMLINQFLLDAKTLQDWTMNWDTLPSFVDSGMNPSSDTPFISDELSYRVQGLASIAHTGSLMHSLLMSGFMDLEGVKRAKKFQRKLTREADYEVAHVPSRKYSTRIARFRPPARRASKLVKKPTYDTGSENLGDNLTRPSWMQPVAEARCQVYQEGLSSEYPERLLINNSCSHLGIINDSVCNLVHLERRPRNPDKPPYGRSLIDPGFGHKKPITDIAFHDGLNLVILANEDKIKTFRYSLNDASLAHAHTLFGLVDRKRMKGKYSMSYDKTTPGPLLVATDGRIGRGGKGIVRFWKLDNEEAQPQGEDEEAKVLKNAKTEHNPESSWQTEMRYEGPGYSDAGVKPYHPSMLVPLSTTGIVQSGYGVLSTESTNTRLTNSITLHDFSRSGYPVRRWVGHGGNISSISPARGPPSTAEGGTMFASGCWDGYARLFDIRERKALPVMVLGTKRQKNEYRGGGEANESVVLVWEGAGRFLISETKEGILTWDVRIPTARCLYELSTGNNQVAKDGLGWDWKRGTLWAATSSKKISSGWRPANVPPWNSRGWPEDAAEEEEQKEKDVQQADSLKDEDEEMEEDEDEGEDEEMEDVEDLPSSEDEESDDENTPRSVKPIEGAGGKWPIKAHHNERHFGWNYTLTGAAILAYSFMDKPDVRVLPASPSMYPK